MNESDTIPIRQGGNAGPERIKELARSTHDRIHGPSDANRLLELEIENSRLHRLVAELLIKNQQLRKSD
jgi:hypothetical protein